MTLGPGELYALGCALAWAVAVILFRQSGESLAPFALNLFKNLMVVPLFLLTILLINGELAWPAIPLPELGLVLLSGFIGIAVGDTLYFRALNRVGASRVAVAQTLYSPFVIGLSMVWLGERLGLVQWVGVVLVLAGILLVTFQHAASREHARLDRIGIATAVLSVFMMAVGIVIAKPLLERYDFLWVVLLRILGGLVGMLAVVLWRRNARALLHAYRRVRHWPQVIAGGLMGTYVSMMLWLAGYKYTQASIAAILNELAAVFIVILAVWLLREPLRLRQAVGMSAAMGGVLLVLLNGSY
ncbi:MAG: DMT family transporter [Gammaproteobacteria bacterium]